MSLLTMKEVFAQTPTEMLQREAYVSLGPSRQSIKIPIHDNGTRRVLSLSVPCQLYIHNKEFQVPSEGAKGPVRVAFLCGGYGENNPDHDMQAMRQALASSSHPPDLVLCLTMVGHQPLPEDQQLLHHYPEAFGLQHYHSVLQQILLAQTEVMLAEIVPGIFPHRTRSIKAVVIGHSAGSHALDQKGYAYPSKFQEGEREPTPHQLPHQQALQQLAARHDSTITVEQIALAPCGELVWWLSYLSKAWKVAYETFAFCLPPNGDSMLKLLLMLINSAPIPPEWKHRASKWSDPNQVLPELIVYLPLILDRAGMPKLADHVLALMVGHDAIAANALVANHPKQIVVGGTHSHPDTTQVAEIAVRVLD